MAVNPTITVIVPDTYRKFRCDAEFCGHLCCCNRPMVVTKAEYYAFDNIGGEVGGRILGSMSVLPNPTNDAYAVTKLTNKVFETDVPHCMLRLPDGKCYLRSKFGDDKLPGECKLYPRIAPKQIEGSLYVGGNKTSCPLVIKQSCLGGKRISFKPVSVTLNAESPYASLGHVLPTAIPPAYPFAKQISEYTQTVINQCTLIIQSRNVTVEEASFGGRGTPMYARIFALLMAVNEVAGKHAEYLRDRENDVNTKYPNLGEGVRQHAENTASGRVSVELNLGENAQLAFEHTQIFVTKQLSKIIKGGVLSKDYFEVMKDDYPDRYEDGVTLRALYDFIKEIDDDADIMDDEYAGAVDNFLAMYLHNHGIPFSVNAYIEGGETKYRYNWFMGVFAVSLMYALLRNIAKLQSYANDGVYNDELFAEAAVAVSVLVADNEYVTEQLYFEYLNTCAADHIPLMGLDNIEDYAAV